MRREMNAPGLGGAKFGELAAQIERHAVGLAV
jgi:hypothetical protein